VLNYNQCIERYKNDYGIKKALRNKELYFIEKGVYSFEKFESDLDILTFKYPKAVLTSKSAFYYHGLSDVIPDLYYLAVDRDGSKIRDSRVKPIYEKKQLLNVGVIEMSYGSSLLSVYDKERLLIELIRNKGKLPYDYYKEILGRYREIPSELDVERIEKYALSFPKSNRIFDVLYTEVF